MKKLLIAIAAIALLASCSKSQMNYEPDKEIGLSPLTENRTKAMVSTNAFPNESFAVWAFYKQVKKGTSITDWQAATAVAQTTYINEKPFAQRDESGLWGGQEAAYFWPKEGSLMFVGYYPVSIDKPTNDNPDGLVKYEFTADVNKMTISGYTPGDYVSTGFVNNDTNADHAEDFMYFNMTAASCDATTEGPGNSVKGGNHVDVVFKHALSWLTVTLKKDNNTPAGATITVKKVYFSNVNTTGTGTVNNSPVTANNETNVIKWETTDVEKNIYVLGTSETNNIEELTNDVYTCKQPVIIPQTMDGNIVITYEIKSSDGSAFTETVTFGLSELTGNVQSWDPAKHYTYNVTIGTSEILIDPAIEKWVDVTPQIAIQ